MVIFGMCGTTKWYEIGAFMQVLCQKRIARRRAFLAATGVFLEPLYNHIEEPLKALNTAPGKAPLSTRSISGLAGSNYYFFRQKVVKLRELMQALCHTLISGHNRGERRWW